MFFLIFCCNENMIKREQCERIERALIALMHDKALHANWKRAWTLGEFQKRTNNFEVLKLIN